MPKSVKLIDIDYPEFTNAKVPVKVSSEELSTRLDNLRAMMQERDLSHVLIYADREHFANLAYFTNFDPRFEEALLIVNRDASSLPLLLVGNECYHYLTVSPLYVAGKLRGELYQSFSLLDQTRSNSRDLRDICQDEGVDDLARVGCAGWKYFYASEMQDSLHAIEIPAYIVDVLRDLCGREQVTNVNDLLMHPDYGLRTDCSASEIAYFEYTNILASEGMKNMLFGLREGMTDHELFQLAGYNGVPLGCHPTLYTGNNPNGGLSSPIGEVISRGNVLSTNVCYWGSNSCRAGWVANDEKDLPAAAQDYVDAFAGPYFSAMCQWLSMLEIDTPAVDLQTMIDEALPFEKYGIFLNPGHLIHMDEWISSPVYPGSDIALRSGMAFQVDIIPSNETYFSSRMEDGVVLADAELRAEILRKYPDCFQRIEQRRDFMINVLGIEIAEELLPLSNIPAIVAPYFLSPNTVFALDV